MPKEYLEIFDRHIYIFETAFLATRPAVCVFALAVNRYCILIIQALRIFYACHFKLFVNEAIVMIWSFAGVACTLSENKGRNKCVRPGKSMKQHAALLGFLPAKSHLACIYMKGLRGCFHFMVHQVVRVIWICLACALSLTTWKGTVIPSWSNSAPHVCCALVIQHVQSRWGMQNILKENIAVTCLKKKTSMQCKQ
jgi:hypothetical protein